MLYSDGLQSLEDDVVKICRERAARCRSVCGCVKHVRAEVGVKDQSLSHATGIYEAVAGKYCGKCKLPVEGGFKAFHVRDEMKAKMMIRRQISPTCRLHEYEET